MASPAEIVQKALNPVPDTLPEDFNEWDSEPSPSPTLVKGLHTEEESDEVEEILAPVVKKPRDTHPASFEEIRERMAEAPRPLRPPLSEPANSQPAARPRATQSSADAVVEMPRAPKPASSEPIFLNREKLNGAFTKESPNRSAQATAPVVKESVAATEASRSTPEFKATMVETDAVLFQSFAAKSEEEESAESGLKFWIAEHKGIAAAAALCLVVVLVYLFIPHTSHAANSVATKPSAQQVSDAAPMQSAAPDPIQIGKPSPMAPVAGTANAQSTKSEESSEDDTASAPQVKADMMNNQLNAPARIPQAAKNQVAQDAPPPAGFGMDGLGAGGANAGVFSGQGQPLVKSAKPLVISSGVATGMLIQKTPPVYPTIAKQTRVSGTVQLQATIAKDGTIKNLHVVDGPPMLRQSAADAVKTWRYKPYKLNNEPVEVETTINVVFSIGG